VTDYACFCVHGNSAWVMRIGRLEHETSEDIPIQLAIERSINSLGVLGLANNPQVLIGRK
jgi:hypothetical protein